MFNWNKIPNSKDTYDYRNDPHTFTYNKDLPLIDVIEVSMHEYNVAQQEFLVRQAIEKNNNKSMHKEYLACLATLPIGNKETILTHRVFEEHRKHPR